MDTPVEIKFIPPRSRARITFGACIVVLFVVAAACAIAALALEKRHQFASEIRIVPETIDLGQLAQREVSEVQFEIRNDSDEQAVIAKVSSSCGCTVARCDHKNLEAHESTQLPVTFDTGNGNGPVERTVTVQLVDRDIPSGFRSIEARIRAVVLPDIDVSPPRLDFGLVRPTESVSRTVTVKRRGLRTTLRAQEPRSSHESLHVALHSPATDDEFVIAAEFTASRYANRYFSGEIRIGTNAPSVPQLAIPVTAEVDRQFTITPNSVFLVASSNGNPPSAQIKLSARAGTVLPGFHLRCSSAAFSARLERTAVANEATIYIDVDLARPPAEFDERLFAVSGDEEDPAVVIPVRFLDLRESKVSRTTQQ